MNYYGVKAIFIHELDRFKRTLLQSLASPIITTSLYFIVFGTAIGSRIKEIDGVNYGSYIVPGMIMLTILTQALSNASFAIYFQKFTSTIFEIHAAPLSSFEIILGFVGSAAVKSIVIGVIIIITAGFFVEIEIQHPLLMVFFLILTSITFSLFGFIVGIYADGFEGLQIIPILVITPLTFLGGSFYSISMLPDFWQTVSLFNPVLYLISGFRYSFYEVADVSVLTSIVTIFTILICCIIFIIYTFIKGYKIKN